MSPCSVFNTPSTPSILRRTPTVSRLSPIITLTCNIKVTNLTRYARWDRLQLDGQLHILAWLRRPSSCECSEQSWWYSAKDITISDNTLKTIHKDNSNQFLYSSFEDKISEYILLWIETSNRRRPTLSKQIATYKQSSKHELLNLCCISKLAVSQRTSDL